LSLISRGRQLLNLFSLSFFSNLKRCALRFRLRAERHAKAKRYTRKYFSTNENPRLITELPKAAKEENGLKFYFTCFASTCLRFLKYTSKPIPTRDRKATETAMSKDEILTNGRVVSIVKHTEDEPLMSKR
jgi:hypothetical protein